MSQFRFTQPRVLYKIKKGSPLTISNDTMTDELAIAFLKEDPNRIKVFSQYPENWEEMLGTKSPVGPNPTKEELLDTKMGDLKEAYPDVEVPFGMKKTELVDAILNLQEPKV